MSINLQLEKYAFYPGDVVKGVFSVQLTKPIRARSMKIVFEGKEHTYITRGSGKNRQVYTEENPIVKQELEVWNCSSEEYIGPCSEIYPFEFQLPANALPTISSQSNTESGITYEINAKIDRPRALDYKVKQIFQVLHPPPVEKMANSKAMVTMLHDPDGRMDLELRVDQNIFRWRDQITGVVKFRKNPFVKVRAIEIAVKFIESFTAQGVTDTFPITTDSTRNEVDPIRGSFEWPFRLTTHPIRAYSVHGRIVQHRWVVEVKVDLPLKIDKHVESPLLCLPSSSDEK